MFNLRSVYGNERGIVLPVALMLLTLLTAMGGAAVVSTRTGFKIAANWKYHTQTFYAAEAGIEKGYADLVAHLSTTLRPTSTDLDAISPPTLSNPALSFSDFNVQEAGPPLWTVIGSGPFQGLRARNTNYKITSAVSGPGGSRAKVTQMVEYTEIPLFQFGAFYGEGVDFEIYAGPPMTFNGRVHANSDMYFSDTGHNGMEFDSAVTATGEVFRHRKDKVCCKRKGNPTIKDANGDYQLLDFDHSVKNISFNGNNDEPSGETYWHDTVLARFGGKLQDKAHGVPKIIPPMPDLFYDSVNPDTISHQMVEGFDAGDSAAIQNAKLYFQADLRIEDGLVKDRNGTPIDTSSCNSNMLTNHTFYDKREEADMDITQVDIGLLTDCGINPPNGVMYVIKNGTHKGVRLVNGTKLPGPTPKNPDGGLTVVSENPIYIKGDYNTQLVGGQRVPAAVMGDAVTILSSNWDDTKGNAETTDRGATNTAVNTAIATGPHAEAAPGAGNGEFNNVLRFLEDWSGKTFTYRGSVIALWHSQQAAAPWRCCGVGYDDDNGGTNYYDPPNRNWGYDMLFDTKLPPGTPRGIIIKRKSWSDLTN